MGHKIEGTQEAFVTNATSFSGLKNSFGTLPVPPSQKKKQKTKHETEALARGYMSHLGVMAKHFSVM